VDIKLICNIGIVAVSTVFCNPWGNDREITE